MNAKRISTGEEVEVSSLTFTYMPTGIVYRRDIKSGKMIPESDLDINTAPEKTVIEGWVARDKRWDKDNYLSDLYLCPKIPIRDESLEEWVSCGDFMLLPHEFFPSITWESEPQCAKIEIILIDEKGE